jgi:hypothetical protein
VVRVGDRTLSRPLDDEVGVATRIERPEEDAADEPIPCLTE